MRSLLEKEGYAIQTAHHADEALSLLNQFAGQIEVLLLDWHMPDISGIELLRTIRKQQHLEHIQVIMHTVLGSSENIRQGIEAGIFFYLVKPVEKTLLITTIKAAITDFNKKKELLKKLAENRRALRNLVEGTFLFRTVAEGDTLAVRIANECRNPHEAIYISELLSNAVEHGNAGLTYEEKTALIAKNQLNAEVARRLLLPENKGKYVEVRIRRTNEYLTIEVDDMGKGFEFEKYLQFDDARIFDTHGRGIAILNNLFPLQFMQNGKKVLVKIPLGSTAES